VPTRHAGNQIYLDGAQQVWLLVEGRVLLVGCCTAQQLYDPASGTFSLTG
jgi:hypothetical protein